MKVLCFFSVFLLDKYAVVTTHKSSYGECFNFSQQRFVFAHLFPDVSIKLTKFHFHS